MDQKKSFIKRLLGAKTAEAPAPVVDPRIQKIMEGIAYAETRGVKSDPYTFRKPSGSVKMGDDIGKYQVTEGTLGTYGQKYLGKPVDANYFQNNPSAQDEYMRRFVEDTLSRGNTPQQVADIHRRGVKNSSPAGSNIYQDPKYVEIFNSYYNK